MLHLQKEVYQVIEFVLHFPITQERLNGLALIAIENSSMEKVDYEEFIENFASKNI